jgi:hypothetical protein
LQVEQQSGFVEHRQRSERAAVGGRGVLDGLRRDALADHRQRFVEIGGEDAGGEKPGTVANENRAFADLGDEGERGLD